ncbi:uncharacterized protein LOC135631770 [Musa acuminata AAA Group]|uniref:uncharacterized protein LOC135631770 n=1 Tax=Musa acuminata AAA Group TaxID=214697 RepID=UPI0031D14ABC
METLVAVAHHRNQYCSRNKSRITDHFGSSPSKGFRVISCRTFQSGGALLQSPPSEVFSFNSHLERKSSGSYSEPPKRSRRSKPIPINPPPTPKGATFTVDLSYCELWAGPAYSNSPPPSSLPIPKFSLRQKRSVSLDIPVPKSDITLQPMSKSAPSSPTRESTSPVNDFLLNNATATENLRRILHLDIIDD